VSQGKKFSLHDLDFNNVGGWPHFAKITFSVLVGFFVVVMAWFLVIKAKSEELTGLERQEVELRSSIEKEQGRAANIEPLRQQLAQMELVLNQMLRQLPSKAEMPELIIDISQTALASGLSNELFQPGPESPSEFYAERPIAIRMVGSYHQIGAFVSKVASLPRVVILGLHEISPKETKGQNGLLVLSGTVKTYRYLDDEGMEAQEKVVDASKKKGRS
jgi:type IV pilus assembly protein PilO